MAPPDGSARILPALLISSALPFACRAPPPAPPAPIQVAAASDLALAFEELGKLFENDTGQRVTFSFAASGTLARQLGQGAPFDLFAAADPSFADAAVEAGACDGASKALYARGHIVAWSKLGGARIESLADLVRPAIKRIAIANPEHAPYGKAAREALLGAGVWRAVEAKIVYAENVRQSLQFAQTGNADIAIIALSLVAQGSSGQTFAIDSALHAPIEQTLVVCRRGKNEAGGRAFAKLVESPQGQTLLKRYGFAGSVE
jgi:molybdate transport system substrate-binding protein